MESIEQHPKLEAQKHIEHSLHSDQRSIFLRRKKSTVQLTQNMYRFGLGRRQYLRIRTWGGLFLCGQLLCACFSLAMGLLFWKSYAHNFTPYLKWQDALLVFFWFMAFVALEGGILVVRFLHALHAGYTQSMVILVGSSSITVRDLSPENLKNIFWIMNSKFWCFIAVLVGLLPAMLLGWTLHLTNVPLSILTTSIVIVLSIAGVIASIIATSFIAIGCIGLISFCCKLGSSYTYQLDKQATIRIDNCTLTITYPGATESVIDLNLLAPADRQQLLALLHKRWIDDTRQAGSSSLDYSHSE
jgi:hypothetical protein